MLVYGTRYIPLLPKDKQTKQFVRLQNTVRSAQEDYVRVYSEGTFNEFNSNISFSDEGPITRFTWIC